MSKHITITETRSGFSGSAGARLHCLVTQYRELVAGTIDFTELVLTTGQLNK